MSRVMLEIPDNLYQRLQHFAQLTGRPLENLMLQTLTANLPPLPEDLQPDMQPELSALEQLNDDALWKTARGAVISSKTVTSIIGKTAWRYVKPSRTRGIGRLVSAKRAQYAAQGLCLCLVEVARTPFAAFIATAQLGSMTYIAAELRRQVREDAGERCGHIV